MKGKKDLCLVEKKKQRKENKRKENKKIKTNIILMTILSYKQLTHSYKI